MESAGGRQQFQSGVGYAQKTKFTEVLPGEEDRCQAELAVNIVTVTGEFL